MYRTCCVSSCTSKQDTVLMHKVPRSSDRQRVWLDIINNRKLDNLRHSQYCCLKVCEKHFERRFKNRLRLRYGAYPTLFTPEEISKGVPERNNYGDSHTCLSDHSNRKDKVHNDHSYVKIGVSQMHGTKRSNFTGADKGVVPVADGVHNNILKDASDEAPGNAAKLAYENAPNDPDPESRESIKAVFSWDSEQLIISADDTDVLQSHQEVARAVLDRDLTETSLYQDEDSLVSDHSGYDHSYGCNECGGRIVGFRYTCVQCADWDVCGACEARAAHAAHYLLRIPHGRPYKEIQALLATIRQHLLSDNHFEPERALSVKSEPEELQEPQLLQEPLELEFPDSAEIENVPEVLEENGARPPPAPPAPDCSEPILKRLPIQIKNPKVVDETSEVTPISSRSEDKSEPHWTDPSPETAPIPNIEDAKNILVRIPAGSDTVGRVKMLNPQDVVHDKWALLGTAAVAEKTEKTKKYKLQEEVSF